MFFVFQAIILKFDIFYKFIYENVINHQIGPNIANLSQVYIFSILAFWCFQAVYPPVFSRAAHICQTTNTN